MLQGQEPHLVALSSACAGRRAHAPAVAEGLRELRAREKKLGIQPDPDLDGYLKATAMHGQRSNTITLLVMRLLGLEVSGLLSESG